MADTVILQTLRRILWKVVVESKYGLTEESSFDFKYIPSLSKGTVREDDSDGDDKARERMRLAAPGVERRNLQAFLLGSLAIGVSGYLGFRILSASAGLMAKFA